MKLPTIAVPIMRNNRLKGIEGLKRNGVGKITASLGVDPFPIIKCSQACDRKSNFGIEHRLCVNECLSKSDWWTSKCSGQRYCD